MSGRDELGKPSRGTGGVFRFGFATRDTRRVFPFFFAPLFALPGATAVWAFGFGVRELDRGVTGVDGLEFGVIGVHKLICHGQQTTISPPTQ